MILSENVSSLILPTIDAVWSCGSTSESVYNCGGPLRADVRPGKIHAGDSLHFLTFCDMLSVTRIGADDAPVRVRFLLDNLSYRGIA